MNGNLLSHVRPQSQLLGASPTGWSWRLQATAIS